MVACGCDIDTGRKEKQERDNTYVASARQYLELWVPGTTRSCADMKIHDMRQRRPPTLLVLLWVCTAVTLALSFLSHLDFRLCWMLVLSSRLSRNFWHKITDKCSQYCQQWESAISLAQCLTFIKIYANFDNISYWCWFWWHGWLITATVKFIKLNSSWI